MSEHHKREEEKNSPFSSPRSTMKQGPNWNFVILVGAVIFSFVICASFLASADGSPILPARFYGNATINDQPAPVGTLVTAVVQGGGGSYTTIYPGRYGSNNLTEPKFEVQGQISNGAAISFFVNGIPAECYPVATHGPWQATYPFHADEEINLDLRAEGQLWTIVASAGAGGSITPSGNVQVLDGEDQVFSITPAACHAISDVLVDGSSVGAVSSYTFYDVDANHTIAAEFDPITYTIIASAGSGGTISPSGEGEFPCGSDQTYTITANPCYEISDVLVDGSSVGAIGSYTFYDLDDDHTIAAEFVLITYTIEASAGSGGDISPSGDVHVLCGNNQSFTITPDGCHVIADVLVDGSSVGAIGSYTFHNIDDDHTITAEFTPITYTIIASAGTGGTISPSGEGEFPCGSDQTYTITADPCFMISDVLVDGASVGAVGSYTFYDLDDDHTIAAEFDPITYTIGASAGPGGAISPSGEGEFPCGSDQTYTITPDHCYAIGDVMVDGFSVGAVPNYTFYDLDDDHTITAEFSQITYNYTATAGPGGSIYPSGTFPVGCGVSQQFNIIPDSGFHIEDVVVDHVSFGAVPVYYFGPADADHTIEAYFAEGGPVYFDETLNSGWNLFSTPILLEPGYEDIEEIFTPDQLQNIDMILAWSGSYWYIPAEDYRLDPLYAIYVKVHANETATATIYPATTVSALPSRYLGTGLSLIGSAPAYNGSPFPTMPVDQALISIREAPGNLTGYTMVISPGLGQPAWVYVQGAPVQNVLPFKGYWVVMENPDTLYGFSTTPIA